MVVNDAGLVGEPAAVAVAVGAHVLARRGLKSIVSRKSNLSPVEGETCTGISFVIIAVVLDDNTSSIGYESTLKKPIPEEVSVVK